MAIHRFTRAVADLPASSPKPGETKQRWIHRQFVEAIETGLLQPGDGVPSTRTLAERWGTSRGVVELAFEQLGREGYLDAMVGRGTQVSALLPERFLKTRPLAPAPDRAAREPAPIPPPGHAAVNPVRAGQPFVARLPDVNTFDLAGWRASVSRAARALDPETLGDADPRGLPALRQEVCRHIALSRGVKCQPDQIMIVTGIRHAIDLCAQAAVPVGGKVALEDPGYAGAEQIFRLRRCQTVDVPLDRQGIDIDTLRRVRVDMAYVTPAHQAPTGVAMSPSRRAELLDWAQATGSWLLEDDYDSDFSYEMAPLPALKSQDHDDRVIFCGSFNKSMFPGLRIAYVVAPHALLPHLLQVRAATGRSNPVLDQLALADFMASESMLRQLRKARVAYKGRRDLILQELMAVGFAPHAFEGLHAGFHFVLRLPPGTDEAALVLRVREAGIEVQGIRSFWRGRTPMPGPALVIGYSALTNAQARWSAKLLAAELASVL